MPRPAGLPWWLSYWWDGGADRDLGASRPDPARRAARSRSPRRPCTPGPVRSPDAPRFPAGSPRGMRDLTRAPGEHLLRADIRRY